MLEGNTKIIMADKTLKLIRDIKVGDMVANARGGESEVAYVETDKRSYKYPLYRIIPCNVKDVYPDYEPVYSFPKEIICDAAQSFEISEITRRAKNKDGSIGTEGKAGFFNVYNLFQKFGFNNIKHNFQLNYDGGNALEFKIQEIMADEGMEYDLYGFVLKGKHHFCIEDELVCYDLISYGTEDYTDFF